MPPAWILLVNPRVHVSTAGVYKALVLNKKSKEALPETFSNIEEICKILHNDLENVTSVKFPVIDIIKALMLQNGALGALMSGSGSTVFGVFKTEEAAKKAAVGVTEGTNWFSAVVPTL